VPGVGQDRGIAIEEWKPLLVQTLVMTSDDFPVEYACMISVLIEDSHTFTNGLSEEA
jgi:hypothetical protein